MLAAAGAGGVVPAAVSAAANAGNATTSFDPGDIVSDDSFFNYQAMSARDVQAFLEKQTCTPGDGAPCLADYRQNTSDRAAVGGGHCAAYTGARNERASTIVVKVARACRINPATLLVLMQKEQSLVTRPSLAGYQKATGYACPDSADCNKKYLGFFNQVYRAAWQFRQYTQHPSDWRYHVGTVAVQYHPNTACGSSDVTIVDQATANLYNYTPYQPNAETLAKPGGPAGACSAYGNLNFSRIWRHWFGSPLAVRFPDWFPPCLNYAGGQDCAALSMLPRPPGRAAAGAVY